MWKPCYNPPKLEWIVVLYNIKMGIKSCQGPKDKEISKEKSVYTHPALTWWLSFTWLLEIIRSSFLLQWWGNWSREGKMCHKSPSGGRTVAAIQVSESLPLRLPHTQYFSFHLMLPLVHASWDRGWQHAQLSWILSYREYSEEPIYLRKGAPLSPGQWQYYINSEELNWGEGQDGTKGLASLHRADKGVGGRVCAVAGFR